MKTILWMYEKELNPEDGGTERISDLIMRGLEKRGYICQGFLEFHKNTQEIIYHKNKIKNLYTFLTENKIDIVINQLGYGDWLLKRFYTEGGTRWKEEGGKVITCLHFDPKQPQKTRHIIFHKWNLKSPKEKINAIKRYVFSPYYDKKEEFSIRNIYKYLYDYSDLFVMLSETHYPYFKSLLKLNDYSKLRAISNPLTFPDISPHEIIKNKKKQVLVVARMSEYHKRISFILKVWKQLNNNIKDLDWQLILVGNGPDKPEYEKFVKRNNLTNVIFKEQQNPDKFYKESSIFLMSSPAEGWGLTITESMQRGVVPIVKNTSPVFSEIIDDGVNGCLVQKSSITGFRKVIEDLIKNDLKRTNMAKKAIDKSLKFSIENVLNKWESIL